MQLTGNEKQFWLWFTFMMTAGGKGFLSSKKSVRGGPQSRSISSPCTLRKNIVLALSLVCKLYRGSNTQLSKKPKKSC